MMASLRLFDALPDFGKLPGMTAASQPIESPEPDDIRPPEPDIGSIVQAEVERAEEALAQRLAEEHAAALQSLRIEHAAALADQATALGDVAGKTIAARLVDMETQVVARVTAAVARIVGGMLSDDLQKRSIESLAQAVHSAIADQEAVRIEVRGPQGLFAALADALPDRAGSIDYVERDGFDLTVTVDGDLFETRLGEWSTALSEILA